MFLIFHLGRPDVLSTGDLGIRKGAQLAYGLEEMPTEGELAADGGEVAAPPHPRLPLPLALARQHARVATSFGRLQVMNPGERKGAMKRHLYVIAATALAAGLIAAGCGDDDDESGDSSLSKDEFIVQANDICTEGTTELNEAAAETFGAGAADPAEEEEFVTETVVPNIQGQIDDIRELVPEDEADEVNGILDEAELRSRTSRRIRRGSEGDPFAEVNGDLTEYGLSACASG